MMIKNKNLKKISFSVLIASLTLLASCTVNPATGRKEWTPLMSQTDEKSIGAEEHKKVIAEYNGEYNNSAVKNYVQNIVNKVTKVSEHPTSYYTVTVLDSPVVNAFALPGGYLYVTRGLIGLANSEAELAGVLGHEAGHVTARHAANRSNISALSGIGALAVGMLTGSEQFSQIAQVGAQGLTASYSRSDEYEADSLGIRYLAKAGYNPYAQSHFLNSLNLETHYQASLKGQSQAAAPDFFASHPNTPDRVMKAKALADATGVKNGVENYEAHQKVTEGMIWGDNPQDGIIQGTNFTHPTLKFAFTVPNGFVLENAADAVTATNGNGGQFIQFKMDRTATSNSMSSYIQNEMAKNVQIQNVKDFSSSYATDAATAEAIVTVNGSKAAVRLFALRLSDGKVYQFIMGTKKNSLSNYDNAFYQTAQSLRVLNDNEVGNVKPYRIRYIQAGAGETWENLAQKMAVGNNPVQLIRAINGANANDPVPTDRKVKIIGY